MLLTFYGNDRDIFDDAFYNGTTGGFDVDLLGVTGTQISVRNPSTGYTTTLRGSGLAANANGTGLAGTLSSLEIRNGPTLVATFSAIDWTLAELFGAVDTLYVSGNSGPLMTLFSETPIKIDATGSTTESIFLLDMVSTAVTYFGGTASDDIASGSGNDRLFGDGFATGYAEAAAGQVYRLYQATLDRAPDVAGHHNWTERLFSGDWTLQQVINGFVKSAEFQSTYGAVSNAGFVTLLYNNVLDRAPDATGLANWTARLDGGTMTRAEVVRGFSESAEFKTDTAAAAAAFAELNASAGWGDDVYRLYQATLDRAPDLTGFLNWSGRLAAGMELGTVINGFVKSAEFQATYGALDNAGFVTLLYQNVLDRAPDAAGLANWTARLDGGMSRAQVVKGFSQSAEFKEATADDLKDWLRGVDYGNGTSYHDRLAGGGGTNLLAGGIGADLFDFRQADGGTSRILDLEPWDYVGLDGFGYADASDALAHMTQSGANVVFSDQGLTITFAHTLLAEITDDMILV